MQIAFYPICLASALGVGRVGSATPKDEIFYRRLEFTGQQKQSRGTAPER